MTAEERRKMAENIIATSIGVYYVNVGNARLWHWKKDNRVVSAEYDEMLSIAIGAIAKKLELEQQLAAVEQKARELERKAFESGVHAGEMGIDYENSSTVDGAFTAYLAEKGGSK